MHRDEAFIDAADRPGIHDLITVEMLIGAGFLVKGAANPKADRTAENRRLEAISLARTKFLRNVDYNRKMLYSISASDDYKAWFEVFNGERAVIDDLAALGSDPFGLQLGMAFSLDAWKNRAIRAAAKKGLLWEMLAVCKNGRERRIIRVRLATPEWVDYDKIMLIYKERDAVTRRTGIPHHVDHIVPLAGRNAAGLHVHDNMQIITAAENLEKMNKFNDWG